MRLNSKWICRQCHLIANWNALKVLMRVGLTAGKVVKGNTSAFCDSSNLFDNFRLCYFSLSPKESAQICLGRWVAGAAFLTASIEASGILFLLINADWMPADASWARGDLVSSLPHISITARCVSAVIWRKINHLMPKHPSTVDKSGRGY